MPGTTGTFTGFKIAAVFQRNKGVRPLCHRSFVLKRLCEPRDARWDCSGTLYAARYLVQKQCRHECSRPFITSFILLPKISSQFDL